MTELIQSLNHWSIPWSAAMLAILWQSTVLAGLMGIVTWFFRKGSPAVRYWLWQIVAVKMLLMPFWTIAIPAPWPLESVTASLSTTVSDAITAVEATPSIFDGESAELPNAEAPPAPPSAIWPELTWGAWFLMLWALIVAAQLLLVVWQHHWLRSLLRATSAGSAELADRVRRCSEQLRLNRCPVVLVTAEDCSPFVCGLWRPKLILPQSLAKAATDGELDAVLLHELAHLRRRDLAWIWIPQLARIFYWFHPLSHWLIHRIRLEAELSCDGIAMATSGQGAGDYAKMLVDVMNRLAEPTLLRSSPEAVGMEGGDA